MSIEELYQELRIPFLHAGHHHCRPGWIQADCPLCGQDTQRYHLGFNTTSKYFHCWKCGSHHPKQFLEAMGASRKQTAALLKAGFNPFQEEQKQDRERTQLKEPTGRGSLRPAHIRYLRERGFDHIQLQNRWHLEGIGIASRLSWRIYIPITYKGKRVSWTTRTIGDRNPLRYISASAQEEAVNHKTLVYGQEFCSQSIVIVEGPADVWAIGPGAGGLFGTTFLSAQLLNLVDFPYRYVCFDSSAQAQERAEALAQDLAGFPGVTENVVLDAEDPGSATEKELRLLRKTCKLT